MRTITIHTEPTYEVCIGSGLLQESGIRLRQLLPEAETLAVVADDTVYALYGETLCRALAQAGFRAPVFCFPAGEDSKSLDTLSRLYAFLSAQSVTRSDALIALGGGVTGDLTGFAAATWLRGVACIQLPTTLLAAIDSSVGGKTAVNLPEGKNLVGAFWQPRTVLCDTDMIRQLPTPLLRDGSGEAVKYGVLYDPELLEWLADGRLAKDLTDIIARCVDWKRRAVEEDTCDHGSRQLLNFGHTLGHAMEKASHHALSHGQAVAVGMAELTRRTEALRLTEPGTADAIIKALQALGLPYRWEGTIHELLPYIAGDKKRHGSQIHFIVARRIGKAFRYPVAVEGLADFLGC